MGEGHLRLVEYVSENEVFPSTSSSNFNRQIFGSIPKNMDEEDMVEPNVSTLDLLKAQRARKAAAKKAKEESETESETEPENPPPASENLPSASENHDPPPMSNQLSWDFGDEATVPHGLRSNLLHKDVTSNDLPAQHNPPIRSEITQPSTPPVASTSAANHPHQAPSSEPLRRHASPASKKPHAHQTQSTQIRRSPVGKSHRSKKK